MVIGMCGACGRMNLISFNRCPFLHIWTASDHPWPVSPKPWMKMTVAVWRPMAGNTKGATLRKGPVDEAALIAAVSVPGGDESTDEGCV